MATKEEIAQNEHFSFCHHVLNSIQLLYFHLKGVSNFFFGFQSRLLHICCMRERVNKYAFKSWILYQVKNKDDRNASNLIEIKSKYLAIRNLDLTTPYKRLFWIDPILYIKMVYTIWTRQSLLLHLAYLYGLSPLLTPNNTVGNNLIGRFKGQPDKTWTRGPRWP